MELTKFEAELLLGTLRSYIKNCKDYDWWKNEDTSHYTELVEKLEKFTGNKGE